MVNTGGTGPKAPGRDRATPCRSFGAAITNTLAGGEVIVLDSGGYGPVTISQSVSIIAPPGVYAGITAFSGNAITISAGTTDTVILRGLTLNSIGASSGIDVTAVGILHIEGLTVRNFHPIVGGAGIRVETSADANVFVDDTVATGNLDGIQFVASSGVVRASLDHVRLTQPGRWYPSGGQC